MQMIKNYLEDRGFIYGGGQVSPDHRKFILFIPKNASTTIGKWTYQYGWRANVVGHENIDWNRLKEMIIIIRDPRDRWISGMYQYLKSYILSCPHVIGAEKFISLYNDLTERLLMDLLCRFDDHVWPQHEYFDDLLPEIPKKFFMFDSNLMKRLSDYLDIPEPDIWCNQTKNDPEVVCIKDFLEQRLDKNIFLKNRLLEVYAKDYSIINQQMKIQ